MKVFDYKLEDSIIVLYIGGCTNSSIILGGRSITGLENPGLGNA